MDRGSGQASKVAGGRIGAETQAVEKTVAEGLPWGREVRFAG